MTLGIVILIAPLMVYAVALVLAMRRSFRQPAIARAVLMAGSTRWLALLRHGARFLAAVGLLNLAGMALLLWGRATTTLLVTGLFFVLAMGLPVWAISRPGRHAWALVMAGVAATFFSLLPTLLVLRRLPLFVAALSSFVAGAMTAVLWLRRPQAPIPAPGNSRPAHAPSGAGVALSDHAALSLGALCAALALLLPQPSAATGTEHVRSRTVLVDKNRAYG